MVLIPTLGWSKRQKQANPTGSEPIPEPAIPAILAAFDKYEVVGLPQGHGMQDLDELYLVHSYLRATIGSMRDARRAGM